MIINANIDKDYFKEINSPEKSYWFGFLIADGCVRQNNPSLELTIELANKDVNHLQKFIDSIGTGLIIHPRKNRDCSSVYVGNKIFVQNLIDLGCIPNKTENGVLNKSLINGYELDFIRGYIDGNGFIESNNPKKYRIVITGKSLGIINPIFEMLEEYSPRLQDCSTYHRIHIEKKNCFFKLLNDLYREASVYLDRKYEIYLRRTSPTPTNTVEGKGIAMEKKSGTTS